MDLIGSVIGTELKINVHVEPIDGKVHLADCEFKCEFYVYTNKSVVVEKKDMVQVDKDNFIALVDTSKIGCGTIQMTIEVDVPDGDFPDHLRKEVDTICTGVKIRQKGVCS